MPITIGQILGRYRIEGELGAGGMGVVYRAHDQKLQRDVAIKFLPPGTFDNKAARKRFHNEALVLSRLNHPSIQTIHDFDTIDGFDLLVSELVSGVSIDTRLAGGPLPEKEVVHLGIQLAQGLGAAHAEGVLHRDLKPSNLRVTPDGRVKILDFGLATLSREEFLTLSRTTDSAASAPSGLSGTLPYMPPEQLLGEAFDERSDLYSAGVTLFEMVTARLPFSTPIVPKLTNSILHDAPPSPKSFAPKLSDELARIILKCLEKDPELRYQSAKELAADLRRMEAGSSRATAAIPVKVSAKRARWFFPAISAAAALALLLIGTAFWPRLTRNQPVSSSPVRWEQLTQFTDSASFPALSPDGKIVAFMRGSGRLGSSAGPGQIWFKTLPDGEAAQLTNTKLGKATLSFSPDGTRVYFTQIESAFQWNTYEVSLFGAQQPKLFMTNATGLSFAGPDHVLFSEMKDGIHMALATSNLSRIDKRDVYVPQDHVNGMAHRSALSPDGKSVLAVEMDGRWWIRCRLLPFDGSSPGREVGPEGSCTDAKWSPDGQWMYFTVDSSSTGFHVWRQRFPDGNPEQLTPRGASEEEGLAVMPDGKSLIVAAGTQDSSIWVHDKKGERQLTFEGFAFLPTLSPDGKRIYYLQRTPGSRSFLSGELWVTDLADGHAKRLLPGLFLSHYSLSHDGKKIAFVPEVGGERTGIWLADTDAIEAPRQISRSIGYRVFFGAPGEVIFEGGGSNATRHIMRINEDGSSERPARPENIMQVMSVSPEGQWAIIGMAGANAAHRHGATMLEAVPLSGGLNGGEPKVLCDTCVQGFGSSRMFAPFATWSHDGKWLYIPLRHAVSGSNKTVALPVQHGSIAPVISGMSTEDEFARLPGARIIPQADLFPGASPAEYIFARPVAKTNLFRIHLSQ